MMVVYVPRGKVRRRLLYSYFSLFHFLVSVVIELICYNANLVYKIQNVGISMLSLQVCLNFGLTILVLKLLNQDSKGCKKYVKMAHLHILSDLNLSFMTGTRGVVLHSSYLQVWFKGSYRSHG